ncbi:MAG TPA: DNA methyltransferase [Candidatus Bathyarchaeia archaeon]|nr:DNA methyltransferase [Candidatus Bathyarchaeia archaeon]
MPLSWNEIRKRAIAFSSEWKEETSESAEAQTFWNAFFKVFGRERRVVALFEKNVRKLGNKRGAIDLFWEGKLVVEHKSEGESLDKAYDQALDYSEGLSDEQLPKYVIVSDFRRFRLHDLENDKQYEIKLEELAEKTHLFEFMRGGKERSYEEEDPVNIKAAELMGKLHDSLKENGYVGHPLEVLLVRLMFCLFADDTGIFEKDQFTRYIETKTNIDGSDVGLHLNAIFQTLNKPEEERQKNLDEELQLFRYVNGSLFEERFEDPSFDSDGRKILLECCHFDWSHVSPAIFGSLFQSVMDPKERRDLGAHYTSEENILKTVRALFLDDLRHEFELHKHNKRYLQEMLERIGAMKFLDPACGCGNFLIIVYRELRRIQIEIHKQLRKLEGRLGQRVLDIEFAHDLNVDATYGIEILEFPARIAEVALWLVDHQMNVELSKELGEYYARLPLEKAPNIVNGNALGLDWKDIVPPEELTYILGNPPYVGKKKRSAEQNDDMILICGNIKNYGILDYVCCWYVKAAEYIKDTKIKAGFVSTNSITQGEQVGILWDYLLNKEKIKIHFAHRTFRWFNQARGKAQVYVVIIGFASFDTKLKLLYDYETPTSDPVGVKASNINPYLVNQKDIIFKNRSKPLCSVPEISFGSMPNDNGNFLFTDLEKDEFLKEEPGAIKYIFPFISAREFLHNEKRWCLWLQDVNPSEIRKSPKVEERIKNVKAYRLKSNRESTRRLAETPYLFGEIRQPKNDYILIPLHSSEHRKYIPIAFFPPTVIANNSCSVIENASLYHFGVLTSAMHMAWMRHVCGRLESRYRYSNVLVYNNFPWPENPTEKQVEEVEARVKDLLAVRESYADTSLADLYDPILMPKKLLDTHKKLDRVAERCYRPKAFKTDLERLQFLFELYDAYFTD